MRHTRQRFWRLATIALALGLAAPALASCSPGGGSSSGTISATATTAPTATATSAPTTCAQVSGFAGASPISLPNMEMPTNAVAAAPSAAFGGVGQYTVQTYSICVPNTTADLTVSTGKGPEPFTKLLLFYGWAPWTTFPTGGDAQQACAGTCFAYNVDNPGKSLFQGSPVFLSVEKITPLANGLVTFTLRQAQTASAPSCAAMFNQSDDAIYGHHPEYTLYYDATSGVQWPPLTRLVGDSTPSTVGEDLCSAGTSASIKAFMDNQFSTHGYTAATCPTAGDDCWQKSGVTVNMRFSSPTDWLLFTPRHT